MSDQCNAATSMSRVHNSFYVRGGKTASGLHDDLSRGGISSAVPMLVNQINQRVRLVRARRVEKRGKFAALIFGDISTTNEILIHLTRILRLAVIQVVRQSCESALIEIKAK